MNNDELLLRDENIPPDDTALKAALGEAFDAYREFIAQIERLGLSHEWRYYKDGKAWLCKITFKKKTVIWMSVHSGFFRATVYFNPKTICGVFDLDIDEALKNAARELEGKSFIPVVFEISSSDRFEDFAAVVEYKKNLK